MGDRINKPREATPGVDVGEVINLGDIVVEGKVSKPEVFYILSRSAVEYKTLSMAPSFVPRILGSVKKNPF